MTEWSFTFTKNVKKRLKVSLRMQKKSMACVGQLTLRGLKKIVHAGDANFCYHEFKKDGQLDMEKSRNGIKTDP